MGKTVDKPDAAAEELDAKATEKSSVDELILRGIAAGSKSSPPKQIRRVSLPIIHSKDPGTLELDNAKIFELIPFP